MMAAAVVAVAMLEPWPLSLVEGHLLVCMEDPLRVAMVATIASMVALEVLLALMLELIQCQVH